MSHFSLRPYQQEALSSIPERGSFLICMPTGCGKCLAKGTPVLMYDGSIRLVETIHEGELVMGWDSTPRKVVGLAHGFDEMYEVIQAKGGNYVVNSEHILSLFVNEKLHNISVKDFLTQPLNFRIKARGWRMPVDFPAQPVYIKPYTLGRWLTEDKPIEIDEYDLKHNRHIPRQYLINSYQKRAELLAGLLDGFMSAELPLNYSPLDKEFCFLARSLGLYVYENAKGKLAIRGNFWAINTKKFKPEQTDNVLRTGIKVEPVGRGEYFGFELEGKDRMFLLGDFTVTHNTVTFSQIPRRGRMLILSHRDELVHQPRKYFDCSFGVEQAEETSHGEEVVSASVQSLVRRLNKFKPDDFDIIITDECFIGSTMISMPNGQQKPISEITEGEYVMGWNDETRQLEPFKVTHTFKRPMPKKLLLINEAVCCTPNHPFLRYQDEKYIQAWELCSKDWLCRTLGRGIVPETIYSIITVHGIEDTYVYNLEVEKVNNYVANGYVVHNCHHAVAPTYRKIYDYFKPRLHLGFTATPNRNDGIGLKAIYQDIIFQRDLQWGINNGYLADIKCYRVQIDMDLSDVSERMGDYVLDDLEEAVNIQSANEGIAEAYRKYAKPPCLIFCVSVAHAYALAELIPGAVAVKGGEDRTEVVEKFKNGEIPCITNCMVFTEGTDIPNINTIIMARPTKNVSLFMQAVGRGMRPYPGKEYMTLIDCVDASSSADICTAPSLLGMDISGVPKNMRKDLQGKLFDIPKIIEASIDTPASWIKNVEFVDLFARKNKYNLHGINFFRMPDGRMVLSKPKLILPPEDSLGRIMWLGKPEPAQKVFDEVYRGLCIKYSEIRPLWDINIAKKWGRAEATEKQKAIIARKFPDIDVDSLSKLEAGQILTRCFTK